MISNLRIQDWEKMPGIKVVATCNIDQAKLDAWVSPPGSGTRSDI
jgi:hypothetical protein